MLWLVCGLGIMAGAAFLAGRWWIGVGRTARTLRSIAPALVDLDEFFALLDLAGAKSHYLERHGPMLANSEVLRRAETGLLEVSGVSGRPFASTRWLSHADLLEAVVSAFEQWTTGARPEAGRFRFAFDRDVGECYPEGGWTLIRTRTAVVIIREG